MGNLKLFDLNDLLFLQDIAFTIRDCRSVLKWSFCERFYMDNQNEKIKTMFEFLQAELDQNTEEVHWKFEQELTPFLDEIDMAKPELFDAKVFLTFKQELIDLS